MKQIKYTDARAVINDGDVVLFQGNSVISKLVRLFTRSRYSHSGVVVWWGDRLMVLESTEPEVRVVPLSKRVVQYPSVHLFTASDGLSLMLDRKALVVAAQSQLGKKYSVWGMVRLIRRFFEKIRGVSDPWNPPEKFVCSQFVSFVYRAAGVDLVPGLADKDTTPEDISKSICLRLVGRLV